MDIIKKPKISILMDASMYDMFLLCPQRFKNRYKLNKSLPTKAKPLDRGTLVHVGAEFYYEGIKNRIPYQDAVNNALMKIKEASVINSDLPEEDVQRVIEVMEEYFDYWRTADQMFEIVEVENPFIYVLYEDDDIRIAMSGKIDLIISDNKYTNLPYDHKSYDRKSEVISLSNQFRNYCWALKSSHIIVNRIGFQKSLKAHEKFIRVPLGYDKFQLDQWRDNVIKNMMYYLQCEAEDSWPMNETSCDKFNRRCEYYDVCESSGNEAKLYKLSANYIDIEPWDVTKVLAKSSELVNRNE